MRRLKSVVLLLLLYSVGCNAGSTWYGKDLQKLALIKEPVVDLFITLPIQTGVPASPGSISAAGMCKRAHQGLFNEVVSCVQEVGDQVQISFDNVLYGHDPETREPLRAFWISRDKLVYLKDMEDLSDVPAPMALIDSAGESTTLVLVLPWRNYSVATRFVRLPERDTNTTYGVKFVDMATGVEQHALVPKKRCRLESAISRPQARATFVALANKLVDYIGALPGNKVVPYVWGGSSCTQPYEDSFEMDKFGSWARPEQRKRKGPYNGYDCSELVLRLAQVSGVPYFYKTTTTLVEHARELTARDKLENGDLFWVPGHVVIISDIAKNEMIEARGYGSGYGKVQRIKLKDYFENIATFAQLRKAHLKKEPLLQLKKDGTVDREVKEFKLLKLF